MSNTNYVVQCYIFSIQLYESSPIIIKQCQNFACICVMMFLSVIFGSVFLCTSFYICLIERTTIDYFYLQSQ